MEADVNWSLEHKGDILLVNLGGRLDTFTSPRFDQMLKRQIEDGCKKLVINCLDLDYLSSAGMRSFLSAAKQLDAQQGKLALCELSEKITDLIKMAGFQEIITLVGSERDALELLSRLN